LFFPLSASHVSTYSNRHVHRGAGDGDEATLVVPGRGRVRATAPEGTVETVTNALCNHPLFKHLSRREIERTVSHADGIRTVYFSMGETITRQGDLGVGSGSMYVVDQGECDVTVDPSVRDPVSERLRGDRADAHGYNADEYVDPDDRCSGVLLFFVCVWVSKRQKKIERN
jgi:hypothetical protein